MAQWHSHCDGRRGIEVSGDVATVLLGKRRAHRVKVSDEGDIFELSAVVAQKAVVKDCEDPAYSAWSRNRANSLVGFRVNAQGCLVGESWVPKAGLTADEFVFYLIEIAASCDRFEFQLTGKDEE